jgi:hypothetical protein
MDVELETDNEPTGMKRLIKVLLRSGEVVVPGSLLGPSGDENSSTKSLKNTTP